MHIYEVLQKEGHYILIVPKVWGYEIWHVNTPDYCCKTLVVYPGYQCSRHFHRLKDETFIVLDGVIEFEIDGKLVRLRRGMSITIKPGTVHNFRVVGNEIGSFLEVSTHHREDDSYRVDRSHHYDLGGITVDEYLGIVGEFRKAHVAIVGDFVLDAYCECLVERLSPEAPVPVLVEQNLYHRAGGAGNAAVNVTALGAQCSAFGLVGADSKGLALKELLSNSGVDVAGLEALAYLTITKTRFMTGSHHHFRLDTDRSSMPKTPDRQVIPMIDALKAKIVEGAFTAVLLSDYDKGLFDYNRITHIVSVCRDQNIPVIADPKYNHFLDYRNCTVLKCNLKEAVAALEISVADLVTEDAIIDACEKIVGLLYCQSVVLTRGRDGMTVFRNDGDFKHIPARLVEVSELSGAGDTVAAILAIALGLDEDIFFAAETANVAASLVVQKTGTASCTPTELAKALQAS
jgi:rfaE bifunctional protein kinase chain/domain